MDYYNILGVRENASKEEIQEAYKEKVKKIKDEVANERRIKLFTKALDAAYEALMKIQEQRGLSKKTFSNILADENTTVIMNSQEVEKELEKQRSISKEVEYSKSRKTSKNKSSSTSSKKKVKNKKNILEDTDRENKNRNQGRRNEKNKKEKVVRESENNTANNIMKILMIPLKILALPIILILSVIILVCKMINIVSWLASKVIIVGAIGAGAIHLYQVYLGEVANEQLLFILVVATVASFFLPSILKVIPKVLGGLNDLLKDFVF